MRVPASFTLILLLLIVHCRHTKDVTFDTLHITHINKDFTDLELASKAGAALLLPHFKSLSELKSIVNIDYKKDNPDPQRNSTKVTLSYSSRGRTVVSTLEAGVNEFDFQNARKGSVWDKVQLAFTSPFTVLNKSDLERIEILSRRRDHIYGEGDVAFYDLAERMVNNISEEDKVCMDSSFLSEKGYLNTFNHVTAQTFMTTIFSEELADFVGDVHERSRLPELVTGIFTQEQLSDLKDGPVDNYIDMLNNDWGQELGKELRKKYNIQRNVKWSPELLADFLNDIQHYYSWVFQIGFEPFRSSDEIVMRFSAKINNVMEDIAHLRKQK